MTGLWKEQNREFYVYVGRLIGHSCRYMFLLLGLTGNSGPQNEMVGFRGGSVVFYLFVTFYQTNLPNVMETPRNMSSYGFSMEFIPRQNLFRLLFKFSIYLAMGFIPGYSVNIPDVNKKAQAVKISLKFLLTIFQFFFTLKKKSILS